jgi:hypothetical protein
MNKRQLLIYGVLISLLVLILIGLFLKNDNDLYKQEGLNRPNNMGSYLDTGYFKIDPRTILASLENGDTDVFTSLPEEEALDLEEIPNLSIHWTQAGFLKIASAAGQLAWGDPMDMDDWGVYTILLNGSCSEPTGLDFASIAYFQTEEDHYSTRLIEIQPYFGWVRWGDVRTYPQPILRKWKSVNLGIVPHLT